jgi:biopolymer transport protein ExbD
MASPPTETDETLSEVNVIPLADLSLVLLIVLMVISPMVMQGMIQVTSGKAAAAQTKEELSDPNPEVPVIVSYEPGALKVNGVPMDSDLTFVSKLETMLAKRRDKSVNLTAAPEMAHGKVVHVMDLIQHHGATTLIMLKWDANNAAMGAAANAAALPAPGVKR